ncbi:MAG: tRNA (adenosine(37)-N6)-threonylcarbamoyltransferase complex ATPase subunit type 1 TsaE [Planctomycetes bacterium]|nr:tRNA (adenosine(37)-N6)-threonylcarbamoyltransferase complex ATPase subunit type 1 TsaE [Planctomycetota bacterium]NUQ35289.1 tRNA (adenosine(37)-N6)-threonylcarbamoyltransferase complex ATPase subunit type 1 TsaE [Planctomycetaceae bacterium]
MRFYADKTSLTLTSPSVDATIAIGDAIGRHATKGLVVALCGSLGMGKTHLTKGIARGLGVAGWQRVHSPTFTLLTIHRDGRLPLYHMDFYRLESASQMPPEMIEAIESGEGVCVIEWADRFARGIPENAARLNVLIEDSGGDNRRLALSGAGYDTAALFATLRAK